ncbi:MAG: hypothetical protein DRP64_09425 [Verrucomicrobia bacterium]|nr:MAG: hypothetical protein DRP64_09425 [Verrucomicrobiota bacterium]
MNDWKEKLKLRLPALALLVLTVLFWSLYDRYETDGPVLLESPVLSDGTNIRGDVSESNGRFLLAVPVPGKQARIDFPLPTAMEYESIRVRARIKVDGVVAGKYSWRCARLLLAQYEANKKWIPGHHGLVSEKGSKAWEMYEDVFEIFPAAARVVVVFQQSGVEGSAGFEQIEAQPVRIRVSFVWWRILFAVLWLLMAFLYFPRCRLNTRKLKILIVLNVIAILFGTLLPGEWISDASEKVKGKIEEFRRKAAEEKPVAPAEHLAVKAKPKIEQLEPFEHLIVESHKVAHFVLFASLCFLVYLSAALEGQHPAYFFKVAFDILLFAGVTEALQFLTLDRTAGAGDLRVDLYGMAAALLLFLMILPLVRRFSAKDEK